MVITPVVLPLPHSRGSPSTRKYPYRAGKAMRPGARRRSLAGLVPGNHHGSKRDGIHETSTHAQLQLLRLLAPCQLNFKSGIQLRSHHRTTDWDFPPAIGRVQLTSSLALFARTPHVSLRKRQNRDLSPIRSALLVGLQLQVMFCTIRQWLIVGRGLTGPGMHQSFRVAERMMQTRILAHFLVRSILPLFNPFYDLKT